MMMIKIFISMTDTLVHISFSTFALPIRTCFFMIFSIDFTWADCKTGILIFFK
jgi:hypothetical protein